MTRVERDRLATPLVLAYWLSLVGGLVVFTTTRLDESTTVIALWVGALGGTMLGQCLALRDYRLWIVLLIVALSALYGAPLVPGGAASGTLWQAFIPAVLCGFWSLGDRAALAACWFPATIWMLSILDRADGQVAAAGVGATLLAGLAVALLAILRAHETRRVGLWRAVAAVPLAEAQPVELLRESPGSQLARAGWGLSTGAIAVALTTWVAPRLWRIETLEGPRVQRADLRRGLPCCPVGPDAASTQARIKEYFDLGRGHGAHGDPPRAGVDCRACANLRTTGGEEVATSDAVIAGDGGGVPTGNVIARAPARGFVARDVTAGATSAASDGTAVAPGQTLAPTRTAPGKAAPGEAAPGEATPAEAAPSEAMAASAPMIAPPPVPPPMVDTPPPSSSPPLPTAARPRLSANRAPAPESPAAQPVTPAPERGAILPWLIMLATAALAFQIVALGLRPIRRLITLRHLRRPIWAETVDQRVSNAWQLALVGLRDAGWRPGAHEAPHALARRVHVAELERCATILERARHGLGIDADDLAVMTSAADASYHAARRGLGPFARVVGWIRWPLT